MSLKSGDLRRDAFTPIQSYQSRKKSWHLVKAFGLEVHAVIDGLSRYKSSGRRVSQVQTRLLIPRFVILINHETSYSE